LRMIVPFNRQPARASLWLKIHARRTSIQNQLKIAELMFPNRLAPENNASSKGVTVHRHKNYKQSLSLGV